MTRPLTNAPTVTPGDDTDRHRRASNALGREIWPWGGMAAVGTNCPSFSACLRIRSARPRLWQGIAAH